MRHAVKEGVLHPALRHDLDVPSRAAAALQVEGLLFTHRPNHVRIHLSVPDPSPASLSVLARARRLCEGQGIPLTVVGPARPARRTARQRCNGSAVWESAMAHELLDTVRPVLATAGYGPDTGLHLHEHAYDVIVTWPAGHLALIVLEVLTCSPPLRGWFSISRYTDAGTGLLLACVGWVCVLVVVFYIGVVSVARCAEHACGVLTTVLTMAVPGACGDGF